MPGVLILEKQGVRIGFTVLTRTGGAACHLRPAGGRRCAVQDGLRGDHGRVAAARQRSLTLPLAARWLFLLGPLLSAIVKRLLVSR